MKKIAVEMSGGIDSSVAAYLLKRQGFDVIGITLKLWKNKISDAKRVTKKLDIPHYVLDLRREFEKEVIKYTIDEYLKGRTPNPCCVCNRFIKFELLKRVKADWLATGHYAVVEHNKRWQLREGKDKSKDQSYFLALLTQNQLKNTVFPLGGYKKEEVKSLADDIGLGAEKESEDVCFIPDGDIAEFMKGRGIELKDGPIVDKDGNLLGRHRGIVRYTIGQRRGLGIPKGRPIYVIAIDVKTNTIIVGNNKDLYKREFIVSDLNWVSIKGIDGGINCSVKIRYKHKKAKAFIEPRGRNRVLVQFRIPQRAITPGQLAVFYDRDKVLGAGWIEKC
jgi:tRNA-specific 2-thiouridylase